MQMPDEATWNRMTGPEQWDWFMQNAIEHRAERARHARSMLLQGFTLAHCGRDRSCRALIHARQARRDYRPQFRRHRQSLWSMA
jgi:hypothetical protein